MEDIIKIIIASFSSLWKVKKYGKTIEIITPFFTTNDCFVSVFLTEREGYYIITDGGWISENYYNNFPKLWCKYGFRDAYNLDVDKTWYSEECIGIDKGISMIMIENYFTGLIWKYFMKNKYIKNGLEILGFTKEREVVGV